MREMIVGCHTSARRYCIDRIKDLRMRGQKAFEIYIETKDMNNDEIKNLLIDSSNSLNIMIIRVEMMKVILKEIESIISENYLSLNQMKESLIDACKDAKINDNTQFLESNEVKFETCDKEKQRFYDFIYTLDEELLRNVKPLFFRRVLSKDTAKKMKEELYKTVNDFTTSKDNMICFKDEHFLQELDVEALRNILRKNGVDRVWEINPGATDSVSYVMDISVFQPFNEDGFNIHWCSEKMDWAIEQNHEGYYFVYGEWLINEIKNIC